jgi:Ca2+-binding RTX toxin-like protein
MALGFVGATPVPHNASITYSNLGSLELDTGIGPNLVHVEGTAAPTTVNAGTGAIRVDVSAQAQNLGNVQGALTVNGQSSASTALIINDQGTTTNEIYNVRASEVDRANGAGIADIAPITYARIANLALYAGSGSNVLYTDSTAAGTTTDYDGGTGSSIDEFWAYLYSLQGALNLHGQSGPGGESAVILYDASNTAPGTYTLTSGALNRTGMAPITYDHVVQDTLYTSSRASAAVNLQSNAAISTIIVAGPGDLVTLGSPTPPVGNALANIQGNVILSSYGSGQLPSIAIDGSGDSTAHTQAVLSPAPAPDNFQLTGLAPAQIIFGLDPTTPVRILGGSGNDTFTVASALSATGITIDGGGGNNTLIGPDAPNTWTITGANRGTLGSIGFANMQNLVGGSAGDAFRFQTGGSLAGTLDGGGGINTLDYSALVGNVLADLLLGSATGVSGGIKNIQNLTGSQGNNLLVGDANANVLIGGTGRNVVIGDGGSDTITGGGGYNLLIGGITSYDANLAALKALMQYWDNPNVPDTGALDQLVNPLKSKNGVTVNGQVLVFNKNTVQNDNVRDYLFSGTGANWFIRDADDIINNGNGPGLNDRVTVI